jgi:hypothetical protein
MTQEQIADALLAADRVYATATNAARELPIAEKIVALREAREALKDAYAQAQTKIVREFSAAGPCITLGEFIKRTNNTITFRNRDGKIERRGGWRVEKEMVHTEPCSGCRDHTKTQYPHGYMD